MLNEAKLEQTARKAKFYIRYAAVSKKWLGISLTIFLLYGAMIGMGYMTFDLFTGVSLSTAYLLMFGLTYYLNRCVRKVLLEQEQILFG
jgi:hypothetical protein